ncbi:MAG: helix-turn-helix domain-containing protein [Solirubrobacterales bacterium]
MSRKRSASTIALGAAIRAVRVERGYTQEGFAAHVGMGRSYYGAIERGERRLVYTTTLRIVRGLEMPAGELLERAGLQRADTPMAKIPIDLRVGLNELLRRLVCRVVEPTAGHGILGRA